MGNAFNEAYGIVQCKECPWYKSCVVPMRFTTEDIRRQMESNPGMKPASQGDMGMENLLSSMASAAQNSLVEGCPVFIDRLRSNPKLAQKVKQMMQNWASEE
jgi:hypothetical protein